MSPFEYIKAITDSKKNILEDEKDYNAFIVNKGLSYFHDTVLFANEMNINHQLDPKLQFEFYINSIRKRKRFSKWHKATEDEALLIVKEYYGYNNENAKYALSILSADDIEQLKMRLYKGGRK